MIRLYQKIPEEFMRLIFPDRFWVVHIPFTRMVTFKFLAQFRVDHLAQSIRAQSYTLSVLICCICLLWDWSFRLYLHITYMLSILALIWLVLIALFCAIMRRDYYYYLLENITVSPVDWGCRIHRLHLWWGVRPLPTMSFLDITLNNLMVRLL